MKHLTITLFAIAVLGCKSPESKEALSEFHQLKATSNKGKEISFKEYSKDVLLIVNTASR